MTAYSLFLPFTQCPSFFQYWSFLWLLTEVIVVHVSLLTNISYNLYKPSATIDSAKTALCRIDSSVAPFGEISCRNTMDFFSIDYDRQSARVTNGGASLEAVSWARGREDRGIEALVKLWLITPSSLVRSRENQLSVVSIQPPLLSTTPPRGGGGWGGAIWRRAPLQWGPSEWRPWHDHLSKPVSAWCSGVPLWTDCSSGWKSGSALAKTGRQWTIRACPESIHISRLGLMCL